ncbi:MAG: type I methionyl aminopeptidase [Candidatus Woykebacteria bacterium RIFCSPHIGHO2_12_FULL_43_10]|uniref:Methionine aminopeptidase n=2 Tax=Candidatus Woykeibacteriota TaxID=1817899 RepID=A0A1G1WXM6_9BACT|nr:MAG: type I methionyl aminopeptidase [Candidatus Woykebacteria bacterium RIFCSPHIGHO2_01_FULL_43_29]OGY28715.1 MAG: type I methionyl aminopeptidase [Candidatus Woykebacteria bacterium RIFCSPHIGHO2_02_FULL_43_16b]OGY29790.1 MAG: type I methionyl aminopeptidase [Candidatus Woykebacteria bacterium RIFCSPHIGHO2_12_FULL_43_10]OGY32464.1 MAG: type I methionyl aminopeptidase [Candidatus Woykebacteria bacterium RIFCSPLOWO2_01_FULL_43_14]
MIKIKNDKEISLMAKSGRIAALVLEKAVELAKPGTTTLEIEEAVEEEISKLGGESAFKKVKGYHYATCFSVNDEVVHGLPSGYVLKNGDILGIDLGATYQGYFSDTATTVIVGGVSEKTTRRFLEVGKETLAKAIKEAHIGKKIGDISATIQENIEASGYSVVRELTGHGIGTYLHEEPPVPGVGKRNTGPELKEGMVIAIEVIYNMGKPRVSILDDGWTIVTSDGSLSGLFEHSIAVTKSGPVVLTKV